MSQERALSALRETLGRVLNLDGPCNDPADTPLDAVVTDSIDYLDLYWQLPASLGVDKDLPDDLPGFGKDAVFARLRAARERGDHGFVLPTLAEAAAALAAWRPDGVAA